MSFFDDLMEETECEVRVGSPGSPSAMPFCSPSSLLPTSSPSAMPSTVPVSAPRPRGRPPGGSSVRSRNWSEFESLCLIEKKRVEYERRHSKSASNSDIMKYGRVAWFEIMESLNAIEGFRHRESSQIQSRWDTIRKEYRNIKCYMKESGAANYWVLPELMKKDISKRQKFSIEFSKRMYDNLEQWHGQRSIFGENSNVMDSDRPKSTQQSFGRYRQAQSSASTIFTSKSGASVGIGGEEDCIPNLNLQPQTQSSSCNASTGLYNSRTFSLNSSPGLQGHTDHPSPHQVHQSPRQRSPVNFAPGPSSSAPQRSPVNSAQGPSSSIPGPSSTGRVRKSMQSDNSDFVNSINESRTTFLDHMSRTQESRDGWAKNFFDLQVANTSQAQEAESKKQDQLQKFYDLESDKLHRLTRFENQRETRMERLTSAMEKIANSMDNFASQHK